MNRRRLMPGFPLSLGITLFYVSLLVILPLTALALKSAHIGWADWWAVVTAPRVIAAVRLSLLASVAGAALNGVFGFITAWVLVRYRFPGRTFLDSMVDLPFALPTAVGGIALTTAFATNGLLGRLLAPLGVQIAFSPVGVVVALTFIGLPFVVRTVQPVIQELDMEIEEAAETLGAGRWTSFTQVILPTLMPALITGFALAFARALGEYGTVAFISGNLPMHTEIAPLLIMAKLEQFDYMGATAIGVLMLCISFVLLFLINGLQWWCVRRCGE